MVQQLSQAPSLKLITLFLHNAGLGAAAFLNFAQADWSCLTSLNLSENRSMRAAAVRHLVQAHFPNLRSLKLSDCGLDDLAIQWLIEGVWPILEELDFSINHLDTRAVKYLAKGNWAALMHLRRDNNKYDSQATEELPKGNWHSLLSLTIDLTALNTANAGMLGIRPHQLLECQRVKGYMSIHCIEVLPADSHAPLAVRSLWPDLQKIFVFDLAGS